MTRTLATERGREYAVAQLKVRRAQAAKENKIDNASLRAGSDMYYYCKACGLLADVLPETHMFPPRKLCKECQAMKDLGWLE